MTSVHAGEIGKLAIKTSLSPVGMLAGVGSDRSSRAGSHESGITVERRHFCGRWPCDFGRDADAAPPISPLASLGAGKDHPARSSCLRS